MTIKHPKKPDLPKPRLLFPELGPRWLKMEPARLAMLGGLFFSTCVMVFYFIRQCFGSTMALPDVVLGVAKTFLVSYAGTGFFVWYLLRVAEAHAARMAVKAATPQEMPDDDDEDAWEENGRSPEDVEEHS